jgi:uncharacterized protein (TIGR02099 family)
MTLKQANGPAGSGGAHAGRHAAEIIHSVEGAVEHAVERAERSLARRLGEGGMHVLLLSLRTAAWLLLAAYFVFCLLLISLRVWWMPHIDQWRSAIEARSSAALNQQVTIGRIDSSWQAFNPRLQLTDVELHDASGAVALTLPQIDAVISWTSVPTLHLRLSSLTVLAPALEVRRISESQLKIAGILIDLQASKSNTASVNWVLDQRRVAISHATVHYYDDAASAARDSKPPAPIDLTDVDILLSHHFGTHYFALRARPPSEIADMIDVRGWFEHPWSMPVSNLAGWSGRVFAQLNYVDLARLESLARVIPAPFRLGHANGALRAWVDFDQMTVQRARADIAFTDVELNLRSDAPPLRLSSLQGRITQQAWRTGSSRGQDISLTHFAFQGPGGLHLPATDLTYRLSRPLGRPTAPTHTEIGVNVLSLQDLDILAGHLPLSPQTQDLITRYSMRGTLADLHAAWEGDPDQMTGVVLRTRFDALAAAAQAPDPAIDANGRPRAGRPGFQNLSGSIDLSPSGGTLTLASPDAHLFFPGVFEDPELAATRLDARVHWKTGSTLEVSLDGFTFSNEDLEVSAAGTVRLSDTGPPVADVTASLARANAAAVYRYVPLRAGVGTRTWLRAALREGRVSAGTLKLRGALDAFPFNSAGSGEFLASMHVAGGVLDYAPWTPQSVRSRLWPLMNAIDADLNVKGDQIDIVGRQGSVYGVRVTNVTGRVSQLSTHDPRLTISGQGAGQMADMVGFVSASPVGLMIGGFLDSARATGAGRVQVKLDVPLNHASDTEVDGSVFFQGNDVALRADMAPFTAATGRVDFNQHGIRIPGVTAGFVGGQARITGDTSDGVVTVQIVGSATPQGVRRQIDSTLVHRLLDNTRGTTRYAVTLVFHGLTAEFHAVSDLVGVTVDLPEPLSKAAYDAMPLHIDLVPNLTTTPTAAPTITPTAAPARDTLHVTAAKLVDVQLARVADGQDLPMRVERGVISIGSSGALPESGLLVHVTLARLDTARWLPFLESVQEESGAGTGATGVTTPDLVAAHIDELWVSGKRLNNVVLGASRAADGAWNANIEADQTSGSLHWTSGTHSTPGRLTARLARLIIPESETVTEVLDAPSRDLPELDVVADDFVLGSTRLGHLELDAQSSVVGRSNAWQLKRLQIDNPDGHISGSGQWQREPGSPRRRMTLSITVDVVNGGNLLARFGQTGAIKNASAKLKGDLSWLGSPFSIDYPTLSGDLQFSADKGQFLKADPGVGRLLGVMSLQSLPRRISLDFRDIFSKGFAFDTIRATSKVSNGVLTTKDFKMIGPDASVLIEGDVNLQTESQNLHVLVLPEINAGSASVVYAFLANPAIGLGTFIAQWVLRHPLSKIFSYEYDVTGSWADPQVKRHERAKPETPDGKAD